MRDAKLRQEIRGNNFTIGKFPGQDKLLPVGKWHLKLNISSMMAPMTQLLVYHIRDDRETVAASHKLTIRPCLHHKVSSDSIDHICYILVFIVCTLNFISNKHLF